MMQLSVVVCVRSMSSHGSSMHICYRRGGLIVMVGIAIGHVAFHCGIPCYLFIYLFNFLALIIINLRGGFYLYIFIQFLYRSIVPPILVSYGALVIIPIWLNIFDVYLQKALMDCDTNPFPPPMDSLCIPKIMQLSLVSQHCSSP